MAETRRAPVLARLRTFEPRAEAVVVWGTGLFLALWYTLRYLGDADLPGNRPAYPLGWWGWFDQSMTLRSTTALARGNLDPSQHHYPLGYSLLGIPAYLKAPNHAFFFVDLLALLGAYAGFVALSRRFGVAPKLAAALFAVPMVGQGIFFRQWIVPWNTTPVAAFLWLLLAASAAWCDGKRHPWLIGFLTGGIAACRPSDVLIALPCIATLAWSDIAVGAMRRSWRNWARLAAGGAIVVVPMIVLHLMIYGLAESPYMRSSAQIGFTLHHFGWKASVLLVDPYPWFADGIGLLQRAPWIALGMAGLIPALARDMRQRMLAAVLVVHAVLYISYVDLLPTGLWRFLNIHYFTWAVPGYVLLAALLVRDLTRPAWPRRLASASLIATGLVLCVRYEPKRLPAPGIAEAVDFHGPMPPFAATYFGDSALRDARGVLRNGQGMRVFLYPGGIRVFGLRRAISGPVAWLPGHAPPGFAGIGPASWWTASLRLGWPRWLHKPKPPGIPLPLQ